MVVFGKFLSGGFNFFGESVLRFLGGNEFAGFVKNRNLAALLVHEIDVLHELAIGVNRADGGNVDEFLSVLFDKIELGSGV